MMSGGFATIAAAALMLFPAEEGRADICFLNMWDNGAVSSRMIFPNWQKVWVGSFDMQMCDSAWCAWQTDMRIRSVTVANFGTIPASDITGVYFVASCDTATSGTMTMTYRGNYASDTGPHPSWTWTGPTTVSYQNCAEPCAGCGGTVRINLYADIGACPPEGSIATLGFGTNAVANTSWYGSIWDNSGCAVPWVETVGPAFTVVYTLKEGPARAAPGDTVTYTIHYGRPGTTDLSSVRVLDTMPPYTHYVSDSAIPAAEAGWDPEPGPPVRLGWTIPGPLAVTGGPTGSVVFSLSVDWGNGEAFEPGSGDLSPPEGARLENRAQVFFNGATGCASSAVSPPTTTVVRRFLSWMLGSNDIMFAQSLGNPPDEMTYSIFVKNLSDSRTWWDVRVWDTVPAELNAWGNGSGLEDPCIGWTMTPTGCAAGAGSLVSGSSTILTWRLDLPPGATRELRWRATVKPTATDGSVVTNRFLMLTVSRTGMVDGCGSSLAPAGFTHLAPVCLRVMYTSYVGFSAAAGDSPCPGFLIAFFPPHQATQFFLQGIQYQGTGWSTVGGVSQTIGCQLGDCIGGFPGNAGCTLGSGVIPGGGIAGCKTERAPATYEPPYWTTTCPVYPANFVYKLTSNSPVVWQFLTKLTRYDQDNQTNAPSTTMTFSGFMHYMWRRKDLNDPGLKPWAYADSLALISTGIDTAGNFDAGLGTTIHLFQYDYLAGGWAYRRTFEVAGNSVAYDQGTEAVEEGPWRTLSSDARLIVVQELGASTLHNKSFDNRGTYMPTAETGYCTAQGSGVFYGLVEPAISDGDAGKVALGNLGATEATVNIERYVPDNTIALAPMPSELNGTSGRWVLAAAGVRIPPGLAAAGNARIFSSLDGPAFSGPSTSIFRVRLQAGGPIQVLAGAGLFSAFSGGSVMHAIDGKPAGAEFWFHQGQSTVADNWECGNGPGFTDTQTINVYCPKTGMAVRCQSGDGYSATYTTGGPDQCISFTALTDPASGARRNYRLSVLGGGTPGNVIAQFIQCVFTEKGYTAPFLQSGVYYTIIMPPVVYSGQYFWITVVVQDVGGGTKTDYGGITSFSGTDPLSRIENQPMDSYNYDWTSGVENGVKVFVRVQLFALGQQSVVAIDTEDGSISGIASTMVVGADVKLSKEPRLAVMSSGEQVQFRICWSNYSTATAEAFTITDAVPMGTSYVPEAASLMVCGTGGPAAPTVTVSYGGASATTPATFNTLTSPTQTAPASTRWLRWTVRDVYVGSTGCVCFRARVD